MNALVRSIVLFGSAARGDHDALSDVDICAVVDRTEFAKLEGIRRSVASDHGTFANCVSVYTTSVVEDMARCNSLFLWHLRLEGKIIHDREGWLSHRLAKLAPYDRYASDIETFREVVITVGNVLANDGGLSAFDLHLLYSIARNTCMLLTCVSGTPSFGRNSSYLSAAERFPQLPITGAEFNFLCKWHLRYKRGASVEAAPADQARCRHLVDVVSNLLHFASEKTE